MATALGKIELFEEENVSTIQRMTGRFNGTKTPKPAAANVKASEQSSLLSWVGFTNYVQSAAFKTLMYRILLTVLIIAAVLAMTAVLLNPASMPVAIAAVVASLGALALKAVLPVAAGVATGATILLVQSMFAGRKDKLDAAQQAKIAAQEQNDRHLHMNDQRNDGEYQPEDELRSNIPGFGAV